jgi:hypothetical protein
MSLCPPLCASVCLFGWLPPPFIFSFRLGCACTCILWFKFFLSRFGEVVTTVNLPSSSTLNEKSKNRFWSVSSLRSLVWLCPIDLRTSWFRKIYMGGRVCIYLGKDNKTKNSVLVTAIARQSCQSPRPCSARSSRFLHRLLLLFQLSC